MKVALYTISYQGLWYTGDFTLLKQLIPKVAEFGYDGYLAYEVCGPVHVNHQLQGIEEVDRLVKTALGYMKKLIAKT